MDKANNAEQRSGDVRTTSRARKVAVPYITHLKLSKRESVMKVKDWERLHFAVRQKEHSRDVILISKNE